PGRPPAWRAVPHRRRPGRAPEAPLSRGTSSHARCPDRTRSPGRVAVPSRWSDRSSGPSDRSDMAQRFGAAENGRHSSMGDSSEGLDGRVTMGQPDWAPEGIDLSRPSIARAYDYTLGGAHNFAVDRELARQLLAAVPDLRITARANRAFLHRAVRFLVQAGIRNFLDIGSGIPTVGNVHEIAQETAPDTRVVYVDIDPVA